MIAGVHFVRKRLRDGPCWYVYAWRGGPQIAKALGAKKPKLSPDELRSVALAIEKRSAPEEHTLRSLIRRWRSRDPNRTSSPEWDALSDNTKRTWGSALDRIEEKWGDVPLSVFDDHRMVEKIVAWRDSRKDTARAADIGVTVLKALLEYGRLHAKVRINVAAGIPTIYRGGDRAEIIWTPDEIAAFHAKAIEMDLLAASDGLRLAAATGLRREDLTTLTWDRVSEFSILTKAKKRSRGRRRFASVVRLPELDALLAELRGRFRVDGTQTILVDHNGKQWHPNSLTRSIARVRDAIGIAHVDPETGVARKKHLHDARGTFATRVMTEDGDITDQELARMMGWSPDQVSHIRNVYVDQSKVVVAIAKRMRRAV